MSYYCSVCNKHFKRKIKETHYTTKTHLTKLKKKPNPRARQQHGFDFEDAMIKQFKLVKSRGYTHKYDAYTSSGEPVQIKYIKEGSSIDLGDYYRNASKQQDFWLIVGFWKYRVERIKAPTSLYKLYITATKWNNLFQFKYASQMKSEMYHISNLRIDDERWSQFRHKYTRYWKQQTRFCFLRFKRDHKKQKRIQCAINNRDFRSYFLKQFLYTTENLIK